MNAKRMHYGIPAYLDWMGVCAADTALEPDEQILIVVAGPLGAECVDWPELQALARQADEEAAAQLLESVEAA